MTIVWECTHSSTSTSSTSATCTSSGSTVVTCNTCGETISSSTTSALGHNYSWKTTTAATCINAGTQTGTCTRCSATTTQSIAATGNHNYNTWTDKGSYEVCKCATCTAYNQKRFTVTYNANGGTAGSSTTQTVTYSTSSDTTTTFNTASNVVPTPPTGKTFVGWSTSSTATTGSTSFTSGSNMTLYAVYSSTGYPLTLDSGDGTFSDGTTSKTYTIEYGQTYYDAFGGVFPTPIRTGYEFQYFDYKNGIFGLHTSNWDTEPYGLTEGTTMTAVWRANEYTVTFNANGGSVSTTSQEVTYDSAYGTLPTPTRAGWTFDGWYTAASGGTKVTSSTTCTTAGNHTLYAHWSQDSYQLILDANGGTFSDGKSTMTVNIKYGQTYKDAMGLDTFPAPTRDGYIFQYFDYQNGLFGLHDENWDTEPYGLYEGTTMTAVWTKDTSVDITLQHGYGGNGSYTLTKDEADTVTFQNPSAYGITGPSQSTFIGWFEGYDLTTGQGINKVTGTSSTTAKTYYAVFGYPIYWHANGGTFTENSSEIWPTYVTSYGGSYTDNPASAYVYVLPDLDSTPGSAPTAPEGYRRAAQRTGKGDDYQCYMLFSADGNSFTTEGIIENLTIPPTSTSGYNWTHFHTEDHDYGNGPTFYAAWEPAVTYNANGGSGSMDTEYVKYSDINLVNGTAVTTYESYTIAGNEFINGDSEFIGWNTKADGSGTSYSAGQSVNFSTPTTLYAQWKVAEKINVTFYDNDGTGGSSVASYTVGSTFGTLPAPTRDNFVFEGWYDASHGGTLYTSSSTVPGADMALYARWAIEQNATPPDNATVFQFHQNGGHIHDYHEWVNGNGVHLHDPWIQNTGGIWNDGEKPLIESNPQSAHEIAFSYLYYAHMWTNLSPMYNFFDPDRLNKNGFGSYYEHNWNMVYSAFHLISRTDYVFEGYEIYIDDGDDIFDENKDKKLSAEPCQYIVNLEPDDAYAEMGKITGDVFYDFNNDGLFNYSDFSYRYSVEGGNDAGTATIIPQAMVNEHVHFVAKWRYGYLNITLDHDAEADGDGNWQGQSAHNYEVFSGKPYNTAITTLPTPTKTGAQFAGTYTVWSGVPGDSTELFTLSADNLDDICTFGQDTTFYADYTYCKYNETVTKAATCESTGIKTFTCDQTVSGHENCTHSYTETIDALGHDYDDGVVTTQPTCTTAGVKTYTCGNDSSHTYTETIAATGHTWGNWYNTVHPSCTVDGQERRDCSVCGHYETNVLAATGHTMGDWYTVTEATCTDTGLKKRDCIGNKYGACNVPYSETEVIDALGHDMSEFAYNGDANCTTDGTQTSKCSRCDYTKTETAPNTAYGHKVELIPEDTVYATECGEKNIYHYCCTNAKCPVDHTGDVPGVDYYVEELIEHNYEKTSVVEPTCTEEGYTVYTCNNTFHDGSTCGATENRDKVAELGHTMGAWVQTKAPTLYEKGIERSECVRFAQCGYYEEREIDKLTDTVAPEGTIAIQNGTAWDKLIEAITFGIYSNDKYIITINATDEGLGVDTVQYYMSETPLTKDGVQGSIPVWATYDENAKPTYTSEGKYIVYAKITDKAGNVTYISTDGLVIDKTAPTINGLIDGKVYCGYEKLEYTYSDENFASITVTTGENVSIEANGILAGTPTGEKYTVVATDKAGNVTTYNVTVFSTHSFTNYVVTKPATCTVPGSETAKCDRCDVGCTATDTREIPAINHNWNDATYEWTKNEDGTWNCVATRICKNNTEPENCIETATAVVTSKVTKPATCTVNGDTLYTAKFDVTWATTQTKTVEGDIDAINHDWNDATYEWIENEDGSWNCVATRV
ncbi:MAG: InlB B-repeat-containing protein, partial [Clostridia bacterium]|nr:InlB B-repeat-containing protein [Clostridia bacterium]